MSVASVAAALLLPTTAAPAAYLASEFARPPMSVRPWVYYWFEGGYASPEGLARDLAGMREKGIGGFLHMQTVNVTGVPVAAEPRMLSPEWERWFGDLAAKAKSNGLTMAASCIDGWGMGGWWIQPADAAKRLVHTEVQVDGPADGPIHVPQPPANLGIYRDIAVLAFPERADRPLTPALATASSSVLGYCGELDWPPDHAADLDPTTDWRSAAGALGPGRPAWLDLAYHAQVEATGAVVVGAPDGGPSECRIEASDNGVRYRTIASLTMARGATSEVRFPTTLARHFRLVVVSAHAPDVRLAEFVILRQGDRAGLLPGIRYWEYKSGARGIWGYPPEQNAALDLEHPDDGAVGYDPSRVVDLTGRLRADGALDWTPPAGRWTIMRFGWAPLGQPARMASSPGLEADPLSVRAADRLFTCAEAMLKVTGRAAPGVLRAFHTDSWEIGADVGGFQPNWTDDFAAQFRGRRGYPILAYLPALVGRIAHDRATTDRFLWDVRATIADLIARFYGRLQERAHARGCLMNPESGYGTYPQPHIDGLQVFGRADLPMAEFTHSNEGVAGGAPFCDALRTAASGARIYGRQVVQAESLTFAPLGGPPTAPWRYLRSMARAYADGLNHAVIHKIVHQPTDMKPGLEDYGLLGRNYTWWPMADGLLGFMGRCQALLRKGRLVADACYYVGEGGSVYVPGKEYLQPQLDMGRDYDGVNAEVLMTRLAVRGGRLVLPDGMTYRLLVLPARAGWQVRPAILRRIAGLLEAGATVLGPPPGRAPGLTQRTQWDAEVRAVSARLWGPRPGARGMRRIGKGRLVWGLSPEALFLGDGLPPDLEVNPVGGDSSLSRAAWIWHEADGSNPPVCTRRFRATLRIPTGSRVVAAPGQMTADNEFTLVVNGRTVASSRAWEHITQVNLTGYLHPGANSIEVTAVNVLEGPAGLIASLTVRLAGGAVVSLATGGDWESSADGVHWSPARQVAPYGGGPWGRPDDSPNTRYTHRRTADGTDLYYVANLAEKPADVVLRFRSTGRVPEFWDPLTGATRRLTDWRVAGGRTVVPFRFGAAGNGFFVFRAAGRPPAVAHPNVPRPIPLLSLPGPWSVRFDPAWGGPAQATFYRLVDWTKRPEEGVRYYSGVATYSLVFDAPADALRRTVALSLGEVRDVARVRLNGRDLGPVWCAPWRAAVTRGLLRAAGNRLEVDVANLWNNRLVKDASLPVANRLTHGTYTRAATDPLLPSGLLGPVRLVTLD